jgi:hypothetical protein
VCIIIVIFKSVGGTKKVFGLIRERDDASGWKVIDSFAEEYSFAFCHL